MSSSLFESPSIQSPGAFNQPMTGGLAAVQPLSSAQEQILSSIAPQQTALPAQQHGRSGWKFLRLGVLYTVLFLTPIAGALGVNYATASGNNVVASSAQVSPVGAGAEQPSGTPVANTVSASDSTNGNDLEYELSLANGFLDKAVKTSNQSPSQSVEEKNQVIELLNQALDAANRAVALAPNDARAYSSRGRVYQATSVVKPEMKTFADQDFAKATSLGATDPTKAPTTQDPMNLLPTQQANTGTPSVIAAPGDKKDTGSVGASQEDNANRGTSTLDAGKTEVFVPYAAVKSDTQLYVNADKNPENLTFYVKNKEEGVGFTIAATSAPTSPVDLTWWEIQ